MMTNIEKLMADEIAKANGVSVTKLGLRFDKVVVRLLGNLRISVEQAVLKEETVIVTITAPIKLPAKTEYELGEQIRFFLESEARHQDRRVTVFQNEVRIRIVSSSSNQTAKLIGLVHNPSTDPKLLLDLATQWLLKD